MAKQFLREGENIKSEHQNFYCKCNVLEPLISSLSMWLYLCWLQAVSGLEVAGLVADFFYSLVHFVTGNLPELPLTGCTWKAEAVSAWVEFSVWMFQSAFSFSVSKIFNYVRPTCVFNYAMRSIKS